MLLVTTDSVSGYIIKKTLGLVMAVREFRLSRPRKAIYEAISTIIAQAKARGANAIVGLRINTLTGGEIMTVIAYGTAVVVHSDK